MAATGVQLLRLFESSMERAGLAWGRGVLGANEPGPQKTERDKRAPAGVFKIGKIYTYDPALPGGRRLSISHNHGGGCMDR